MLPTYTVRLALSARRDLFAIFDWISIDSPDAAATVIARLTASIDSLAHMPALFRVYRPNRQPSRAVHAMTRRPYVVYYRIYRRSLTVIAIAVRHGRRKPPLRF